MRLKNKLAWMIVASGSVTCLIGLAFHWYKATIILKTFRATFLFGGLRGVRMLGVAGEIQYEFYGVSSFWTGQEEALFQYLAWGADLLVGLGLLLSVQTLMGRTGWKRGIGGGISTLAAALIPWGVVNNLTLFLSAPPEVTVTIQVRVMAGIYITLVSGLLMLLGSLMRLKLSKSSP